MYCIVFCGNKDPVVPKNVIENFDVKVTIFASFWLKNNVFKQIADFTTFKRHFFPQLGQQCNIFVKK